MCRTRNLAEPDDRDAHVVLLSCICEKLFCDVLALAVSGVVWGAWCCDYCFWNRRRGVVEYRSDGRNEDYVGL